LHAFSFFHCIYTVSIVSPVITRQQTFEYIDSVMPNGTSVVIVPVIDGRLLYDAMHDKPHPVGRGTTFAVRLVEGSAV